MMPRQCYAGSGRESESLLGNRVSVLWMHPFNRALVHPNSTQMLDTRRCCLPGQVSATH